MPIEPPTTLTAMSDADLKQKQLVEWLQKDPKSSLSSAVGVRETSYGGRGIFADTPLKARQQIIRISPSYLLNFTTIVSHIVSWCRDPTKLDQDDVTSFYTELHEHTLHRLTSFQIMSMYLCLELRRGSKSWWKPFLDSLPPVTDFDLSPLVWLLSTNNDTYSEPYASLPHSTRKHASKMYTRYTTDLEVVRSLLTSHSSSQLLSDSDFLWAWFCVNSRCLYMSIPEAHTKDDNFTMAPYVDFINHSPHDHCVLQADHNGFHVLTSQKYAQDEELYLSYGPHSNEFLLCEYGFVLPRETNPWNDVDLTSRIVDLLSEHQCDYLKEKGYWGEYTINLDSVSFRVEVALAVLLETDGNLFSNRRINALISGVSDGNYYKRKANLILEEILEEVKQEYEDALEELDGAEGKESFKVKTVIGLYMDQKVIVDAHLAQLREDLS